MNRTIRQLAVISVIQAMLMVGLFSCSFLRENTLTPKQTLYWAMSVYNSEWDSYIRRTIKPEYVDALLNRRASDPLPTILKGMIREDVSDEEWEVLKVKKNILEDAFPLIQITDEALMAGGMPPEETQDDLIYLINRLVGG